jgi:hypothetical protein
VRQPKPRISLEPSTEAAAGASLISWSNLEAAFTIFMPISSSSGTWARAGSGVWCTAPADELAPCRTTARQANWKRKSERMLRQRDRVRAAGLPVR